MIDPTEEQWIQDEDDNIHPSFLRDDDPTDAPLVEPSEDEAGTN